jgi:hypothetical protein
VVRAEPGGSATPQNTDGDAANRNGEKEAVGPWTVVFSTRGGGLVVDPRPWVSLVFPDILSCPAYRQQFVWQPASRPFTARIPLVPLVKRQGRPATIKPGETFDFDSDSLGWRPVENGIVWAAGPHWAFHINSEATVLTVGDREFLLTAPRRTIVVEEDGRITLPDWDVRWNDRILRFETVPSSGSRASSISGGGMDSCSTHYLKCSQRRVVGVFGGDRDDDIGVLALSPVGPEVEALHRKVFEAYDAGVRSGAPPEFLSPETMGDYDPKIGITLVFKWHQSRKIPASERSSALGGTGDANFNMKAEQTRRGWTIGLWHGAWPDTRKVEDLRALGCTEDGQFILRLGAAGQRQDVVLDGKGAVVGVGDRHIALSREEKTTIVIGGNLRKKEPLRVLRIESTRPSPAN